MKAWRFYAFGDMRLDDVPEPGLPARPRGGRAALRPAERHRGPARLRHSDARLREHQAPARDRSPGAAFRSRILRAGDRGWRGSDARQPGRPRGGAGEAALRGMPFLPRRQEPSLPQGPDHRVPASRLFCRAGTASGDRPGASRRPHLGQRGRLPAVPERQRGGRRDGRDQDRRFGRDLRAGEHGARVPADRPDQRGRADRHRRRARRGLPGLARAGRGCRIECPRCAIRSPRSAS